MEMKLDSLEALYVDQLKDLYNAEKQLMDALPKMARAAHSSDLQKAFEEHLDQTKKQARRLDRILSKRSKVLEGVKCLGMEGLIKEADKYVHARNADPQVQDAALIAAAQRIEHYEISGYGTARAYADTLEFRDDARLLEETLDEESRTDEKLTTMAESHINEQAIA